MELPFPFEQSSGTNIEAVANDNDKGNVFTLPRPLINPTINIISDYYDPQQSIKTSESDEEKYFTWMLDELMEAGYIIDYSRPIKSFDLSPGYVYKKELPRVKSSNKIEDRELLAGHVYTPDFIIIWDSKAVDVFVHILETTEFVKDVPFEGHLDSCGTIYSIVEVKPSFDMHNMTREFNINRKWVYLKYGVYIDLKKIPIAFKHLFVPERYLFTDKTGKTRKIGFKFKTFKEYCHDKKPR